jgi:preprotein translocase subunit SecB
MPINFNITDIRLYTLKYAITTAQRSENQTEIPIKTDYTYQSFHDEPRQTFRVLLGVHIYGEFLPYTLQVDVLGTFVFDHAPDTKEEQTFTTITSPTMLFPYLREIVSDTTQRAGHPPVYLHPVNFYEVSLQLQSKKSQEAIVIQEMKDS